MSHRGGYGLRFRGYNSHSLVRTVTNRCHKPGLPRPILVLRYLAQPRFCHELYDVRPGGVVVFASEHSPRRKEAPGYGNEPGDDVHSGVATEDCHGWVGINLWLEVGGVGYVGRVGDYRRCFSVQVFE